MSAAGPRHSERDYWLERAAQCRRSAAAQTDDEVRDRLLGFAQTYRALAGVAPRVVKTVERTFDPGAVTRAKPPMARPALNAPYPRPGSAPRYRHAGLSGRDAGKAMLTAE